MAVLWREERLPLLDSSASVSWPSVGQRRRVPWRGLGGNSREFVRGTWRGSQGSCKLGMTEIFFAGKSADKGITLGLEQAYDVN